MYWKVKNLLSRWLSIEDVLSMYNMWLKIIRWREIIVDKVDWIALWKLDRSDVEASINYASNALDSISYEMYR